MTRRHDDLSCTVTLGGPWSADPPAAAAQVGPVATEPSGSGRMTDTAAVDARRARAARLVVVCISEREYHVTDPHGTGRAHVVLVDGQGILCDCEDFRYGGAGTCKHLEAVLLFQQRQVTPMAAAEDVLTAGGSELAAITAEVAALSTARGRLDPITQRAWVEETRTWLHEYMDQLDGEIRALLDRIHERTEQERRAAAVPPAPPAIALSAATVMQKYRDALARVAQERVAARG